MFILVTNKDNTTFRNIQWNLNSSNKEENPNYFFSAYHDILVAKYMFPFYENFVEPNFYQVSGNPIQDSSPCIIRKKFSELTCEQKIDVSLPSNQQRLNFAILTSLQMVLNPIFCNWALDYLLNKDNSKETAFKISKEVISQYGQDIPKEFQYLDSTHAIFSAILLDNIPYFTAASVHKAYCDSNYKLNIAQSATIADSMNSEEIAKLISTT